MPALPGTLILICGLPGAGKTTQAKRLEVERRAIRLCPDEWIEELLADPGDIPERDRLRDPVENLQWDLAQAWLAKGLTVILENGFWAEEERSLYAVAALEIGARIELHYIEATFEELWARVERRNEILEQPTWVMTKDEVLRAWRQFQPPDAAELAFYDDWRVVRGS